MDLLTKQLHEFKAQEKKQEMLQKKIGMQESKVKHLNDDIEKFKKNKETLEKKMREDTDKFSKYKQAISKELADAKRSNQESQAMLNKMKTQIKKQVQVAQ